MDEKKQWQRWLALYKADYDDARTPPSRETFAIAYYEMLMNIRARLCPSNAVASLILRQRPHF